MGRRGMAASVAGLLTFGLLAMAVSASAATKPENGGFETGDFSKWRTGNRGAGEWFVYRGTTLPGDFTGGGPPPFYAPPEGTYAAVTNMPGPGAHILHRVVRLPDEGPIFLKFSLYWRANEDFRRGDGFRFMAGPNQQFRVDLLKPGARRWSTDPDDILRTLFRVNASTRHKRGPMGVSRRITAFRGERVRLRFGEVDNQGVINLGVDRVRIVTG